MCIRDREHAVRHHQRGQLAAGEHIVPDADLLIGQGVDDALVHALVVAAHQQQALAARQFPALFLGEGGAAGREEHDVGPGPAGVLHLADDVHAACLLYTSRCV